MKRRSTGRVLGLVLTLSGGRSSPLGDVDWVDDGIMSLRAVVRCCGLRI